MESRSMNVFFRIILKMGIAIICMSCFCAPVYFFSKDMYQGIVPDTLEKLLFDLFGL